MIENFNDRVASQRDQEYVVNFDENGHKSKLLWRRSQKRGGGLVTPNFFTTKENACTKVRFLSFL